MSVVDQVKQIIAEKADGHQHALLHIAAEVEGLKSGIAPADKDSLRTNIEQRVEAFLGDLKAAVEGRIAELEAAITRLSAPAPMIAADPVSLAPDVQPAAADQAQAAPAPGTPPAA